MSVEDRAEELNFLAEKIRGSFRRFNFQFKIISKRRNSIQRNIAETKKRKSKLKTSSSSFGRTVNNVTSKVIPKSRSMFSGLNIGGFLFALPLLGKVLGFAAIALFGVTAFNMIRVNNKLDDEKNEFKEKSDNAGNFITGMVDGVKGFIGGFGTLYKKTDKVFDDVDNSLKDAESELSKFEGDVSQLDNFDLKNILTNSRASDQDLSEEEEEELEDAGVDPKFKKPPANSLSQNSDTEKNYFKTRDEFAREGVELRKTTKLTADEERQIELSNKLLNQIRSSDLNISDSLKFDTLDPGVEIDGKTYEGDVIIIRQTIVR